jgi:hypothetical protein
MKRQKTILISVGVLVCSASQIITHLYQLSDSNSGVLMGIGIGISILGFINPKQKLAK